MASRLETVEAIAARTGLTDRLTWKRMFGEFALYLNEKYIAMVADDRLFLKPTDAVRTLLGSPVEARPYPGAKYYFLAEDELESPALLRKALEMTEAALPPAKPKPAKRKKMAATTRKRAQPKTKRVASR